MELLRLLSFFILAGSQRTCSRRRGTRENVRKGIDQLHSPILTMIQQPAPHSRRFSSRVAAPGDVHVCWGCAGYDDTSHVQNLSSGGLFLQTRKSKPLGTKTSLHFLVEEGQIRADAVVCHVKPGCGLGLKFTAIRDEDRRRLAVLMKRLRWFGLVAKYRTGESNAQAPLQ